VNTKQKLPEGWDEAKIQSVLTHYENQSEEEQLAEIEAAWEDEHITMMAVPTNLVAEVQALITRRSKV
jgi:hypothetical protein